MPHTEDQPQKRPSVFLSYAHESNEHKEKVYGLAASLRKDGFEILIDIEKNSSEDWPLWMQRQLQSADFVICICNKEYLSRFDHEALPDGGLGVGWEGGLIRKMLYASKLRNGRVFPVWFSPGDEKNIPLTLSDYDRFPLTDNACYVSLLRKLTGQPEYELPAAPIDTSPLTLQTKVIAPLFSAADEKTSDHKQVDTTSSVQREKLLAELLRYVEILNEACFSEACRLLKADAEITQPRVAFRDKLVSGFPIKTSVNCLRAAASKASERQTEAVEDIIKHLVPLRLGAELATSMTSGLRTISFRFVEELVKDYRAAETMVAAHDCRPVMVEQDGVASTALGSVGLPNSGGAQTALNGGAVAFLGSLLGALSRKFFANDVTPESSTVKTLADMLEMQIQNMIQQREETTEFRPTFYVLLKLPDSANERISARKVIAFVSGLVPSLLFVELAKNPRSQKIEADIIYCLSYKG